MATTTKVVTPTSGFGVVTTDLPKGYRILRRRGEAISNGFPYFEVEHMDRGEWIGISWNKMDWQYSPYTLKTHAGSIAFLKFDLAVAFILGFNWHY